MATYKNSLRWVLLLSATALILSFFQVQAFTCFGIDASNPLVCGGKGRCIFDDFCECTIGAMGSNCTEVDCGWMQDSMGAPQPSVNAYIKSQRVFIDVLMAKRTGVQHRIGFQENLLCDAGDPKVVPNANWILTEETSCFVKYTLNRTLQEHLNDQEVNKVFGDGDVFQAVSPIFASYLDFSDGQGCKLTTFKTEWTINIYLQAVSTATFGGTNDPIGKLRQDRIRVLDDGRLEILATLTMSTAGQLSNFTFTSSSLSGVALLINGTVVDGNCGNAGQSNCKYSMSIQTTTVKSDYSGKYAFNADLQRQADSLKVDITFLLQYATPVPPAATNVNLTTKSSFYGADFAAPKTVFSSLDDAWIMTEIVEAISVPSRALTYKNAYLCCMEDRGPMPEYDPTVGKLGCATKTANMAIWAQLITSEQPLVPQYNTKLRKLAFIDTKTGMSFNLLPLLGENRLCYVQVETFLKAKTSRRSNLDMRTSFADDEAALASFTPLQIISAPVVDQQNPVPQPSPATNTQQTKDTNTVKSSASATSGNLMMLAALFAAVLFVLL